MHGGVGVYGDTGCEYTDGESGKYKRDDNLFANSSKYHGEYGSIEWGNLYVVRSRNKRPCEHFGIDSHVGGDI